MENDSDPIARLTFLAGALRQHLATADADDEHLIALRLDCALEAVRERIDALKAQRGG